MHAPTFLLTLLAGTALAAPGLLPKFDPSNPLNLPVPLPLNPSKLPDLSNLDPAKLAETFQNLIPKTENIGLPSHAVDIQKCVSFCDEHKRMCSMFKLGSSISSNLCDTEYLGCVKVCVFALDLFLFLV